MHLTELTPSRIVQTMLLRALTILLLAFASLWHAPQERPVEPTARSSFWRIESKHSSEAWSDSRPVQVVGPASQRQQRVYGAAGPLSLRWVSSSFVAPTARRGVRALLWRPERRAAVRRVCRRHAPLPAADSDRSELV